VYSAIFIFAIQLSLQSSLRLLLKVLRSQLIIFSSFSDVNHGFMHHFQNVVSKYLFKFSLNVQFVSHHFNSKSICDFSKLYIHLSISLYRFSHKSELKKAPVFETERIKKHINIAIFLIIFFK
jgi:hypothetical protein